MHLRKLRQQRQRRRKRGQHRVVAKSQAGESMQRTNTIGKRAAQSVGFHVEPAERKHPRKRSAFYAFGSEKKHINRQPDMYVRECSQLRQSRWERAGKGVCADIKYTAEWRARGHNRTSSFDARSTQ